MEENLSILSLSPLFHGITEAEFLQSKSIIPIYTKFYRKSSIIITQGTRADFLGLVARGKVRIVYEDVFGNRNILKELCEGEMFGEAFAFARMEEIPMNVEAGADCEILFINCGKLLEPLPENTESQGNRIRMKLMRNMVWILAGKNVTLNQKIRYLSRRTTREKLLAYFSDAAKQEGSSRFTIPFNRQELADFLCVERSAMSAELGRMKREGILDFERNMFVLHTERREEFTYENES